MDDFELLSKGVVDLIEKNDLKAKLVGTIVSGTAYSRAEVYQSGVVTKPLQETTTLQRLHAMNAAISAYSDELRNRASDPSKFVAFGHMPGNSGNPNDQSACWK